MATYDLTSNIPAASSLAAGDILNCPYSGAKKEITLPKGKYKLEVWGAQGGYRSNATYGGKGGYSYGTINLPAPTTVYLYAGGFPGSTNSSAGTSKTRAGGFNGGGNRYGYYGGGGGSDIRIGQDSLYARVIVAGGGGSDGATSRQGMYGGGASGGSSNQSFGSGGGGGTQTAGGAGGSGNAGSFGQGGQGKYASSGYAGAGGGGWYGGGGSYPDGSGDDDRGGGGGSGYILTSSSSKPSNYLLGSEYYLTDAAMVAGNASFKDYSGSTVTGHSGHGACRITVIEVIQSTDENGSKNLYIKTDAKSSLPSGYIELPYIQATGTQYINSNVVPTLNTKIEYTCATTATDGFYIQAGNTSDSSRYGLYLHKSNGKTILDFAYGSNGYKGNIFVDVQNPINVVYQNGLIICNKQPYIFTEQTTFTQTSPIYLFYGLCLGIIYSCKIYENNTLIRNYIPALRTSDSKAGLYDLVNKVFYPDAAGGNFIYNRNNYIDDNTIYYIKGDSATTNLGKSGTITNSNVVATPNDLLYFNGSSKLSLSNNICTGTNDFTIDWWEYFPSAPSSAAFYHSNAGTDTGYGLLVGHYNPTTTSTVYASSNGTAWDVLNNFSLGTTEVGKWTHRALVRKGSNFYGFKNGKLISTASSSASIKATLTSTIGDYRHTSDTYYTAYLKHIRISNIARWTSDFTPPSLTMGYGSNYAKITESYIKVPKNQAASFDSNYYPLNYIESSGTQWINTNFTPKNDSSIFIDAEALKNDSHAALCTARSSASTSANTIMILVHGNGYWCVDRGSTASNRKNFEKLSLTGRVNVHLNKHHISFNDGEFTNNYSTTDSFTCANVLTLLCDQDNDRYYMKARIYACKIWDNGTLVRDYVPALRKSDNMAGLYDLVNKVFYTDAAGGNFIYNTDATNGFYIKGDGSISNLGNGGTITNSNVNNDQGSLYFNGTNSKITLSSSVTDGNDWTVDYWEYRLNAYDDSCAYHQLASTSGAYGLLLGYCSSSTGTTVQQLYASSNGTSWTISGVASGNKKINEWVHRAFVKKGNKIYTFENGKLYATIDITFNIPKATNPTLGIYAYTGGTVFYSNMYMKQFRASSFARWINDFTPPSLNKDSQWRPIESIYLKTNNPSGYTRLEYLESTGTQYTDTGLIPNQNTKTVIDCVLPTTSSGSYYICGARQESYVGNYSLQTTTGMYYSKHGTADVSLSIPSIDHRMKFIKDGHVFSVDGNLGYNTPVNFTSPNSMYIFACNSAGSIYGLTPCKIYRVQIYQDGTNLSRDMVPALRNSDKKTGFYDLVNSKFYPNLDTTAEFNFVYSNGWEKIT